MSLTLITPATGAVYGNTLWFPSKCGFCLCFADGDLLADVGTNAELILNLPTQPANNDTFEFQGQEFTYKTTATLPWEITIGISVAFTLTATANALATHSTMNSADYLIIPALGFIVVSANRVDSALSITFTAGTSPLSLVSNVAGVDPSVLADDYRVFLELLVSTTEAMTEWVVGRGFVVVPNITANPLTGEWTIAMCIPIDQIVNSHITRTIPDTTDATPDLTALHYDWLVRVKPRFSRFYDGTGYPWYDKADEIDFTDALCPVGIDYEQWSPYTTTGDILMMLVRRENLVYCRDTMLFFYCAVRSGVTYDVNIEWNDGSGWTGASDTVTPTRDTILEIRPHSLYPSGFEGEVSVQVTKTGNDYEKIYFTLRGACCDQTIFYFANRYGKYEIIQCLPESSAGVEVEASKYTTCETCDNREAIVEYASTYTEVGTCFTDRMNIKIQEDQDFILDFFTSTDVHMLLPDGTLERVLLDRGTTAIRQSAGNNRMSFEVKYRKQPKRGN